MSAAFTPGPWTAERHPTGWQIDASQDAVATTAFCYAREADANASLIAAAPALYEALDKLMEWAAGDDREGLPVFDEAEAALALARGETNHPEHCGGLETSAESGEPNQEQEA